MSDATLTPVAPVERIPAMDVLRGFALLGILLMNIEAFVGPILASQTGLDPRWQGVDRWADALVYILVQGKFYSLFSLLFGMGFAVMLERAQRAKRPFVALYLRRTGGLLVIGMVHAVLIWSGDILIAYALTSLPMLLFFRRTETDLLPISALGLYGVPVVAMLAMGVLGSIAQSEPQATAHFHEVMLGQAQAWHAWLELQRTAYGGNDFAAAVVQRWGDLRGMFSFLPLFLGWLVLGLFLLGSWFVRSGAIARPQAFPLLYARLRHFGLPLGLGLMLVAFWLMPTNRPGRLDLVSGLANALVLVSNVLMCLGYLAWIVRGLQSPRAARCLVWLAPAGRMALTNYLTQSIVCVGIFYGYGLGYFDQLGRAWQVLFAFALFGAQVLVSRAWLARFAYGPVEWVWRAVTYGHWPAMRRAAGVAT